MLTILKMLFMHCIGDYSLQGEFLSSAKRKSFWITNSNEKINYLEHYVILFIHAYIWSFCINIPLFHMLSPDRITISIITNCFIHMIIDNLKANRKAITLLTDQLLHLLQIVITYLLLVVIL